MDQRSPKSPLSLQQQGSREILMGKYELGRLLGRGTFAKVYYARSIADGSGVAIKVLDKTALAGDGTSPRVLSEVMAMKRLCGHPNVLCLHEVLATKKKIYLVMEHAPRGDLLSFIARRGGRLPESMARRYFQQLLSALRFSHSRGVAHRDVKPQNLLLDSKGELKLADFGLSALLRSSKSDEQLRTACGTPAYTAPEVVRRNGYDGARADAWSCGVILYVLLAGRLPFDDSNLAVMYKKIHRREYKFPPWFPPPARRVVWKLLDPKPETRMTIEAVMELPWFKRSFSEPIVPPPPMAVYDELAPAKAITLNAFDIISMSAGLDLSGLFDGGRKKEQRFTSTASVEKVMEKVKEIGTKLGYVVERRKEGTSGGSVWAKWTPVITVEVSVVAQPLVLVELRIEGHSGSGGDEEDEGSRWEEVRTQLGDLVCAWHSYSNSDTCDGER